MGTYLNPGNHGFRGIRNDIYVDKRRLIHLGYLAYDEEPKQAHIPNEEIRLEFARAIREVKRDDTVRRIRESEQLIFKRSGKDRHRHTCIIEDA